MFPESAPQLTPMQKTLVGTPPQLLLVASENLPKYRDLHNQSGCLEILNLLYRQAKIRVKINHIKQLVFSYAQLPENPINLDGSVNNQIIGVLLSDPSLLYKLSEDAWKVLANDFHCPDFIKKLKAQMRQLEVAEAKTYQEKTARSVAIILERNLKNCSHVFVYI